MRLLDSSDRPEFSIAYRKDNHNRAVVAFAQMVIDYFRKHHPLDE